MDTSQRAIQTRALSAAPMRGPRRTREPDRFFDIVPRRLRHGRQRGPRGWPVRLWSWGNSKDTPAPTAGQLRHYPLPPLPERQLVFTDIIFAGSVSLDAPGGADVGVAARCDRPR